MNPRIVFWSVTSALAGFLFGFETVVISGAEQKIQALWRDRNFNRGRSTIRRGYGVIVGLASAARQGAACPPSRSCARSAGRPAFTG